MRGTLRIFDLGLPGQRAPDAAAPPPHPRNLAEWRDHLRSSAGSVGGVDGERVPVDLTPWDQADDRTLLTIYIEWVDPALIGTKDSPRDTTP